MAGKAIVIANHSNKTATLSFIDEENALVAVDHKGQELKGINFSYDKITEYDFMFESLGMIDEVQEKFHFKFFS